MTSRLGAGKGTGTFLQSGLSKRYYQRTSHRSSFLLAILLVLLHNVDAHNVNVTGRVCYLRSCTQRKHTKHKIVTTWKSHNVQRHKTIENIPTFCNAYVMCTLHFVMVYVLWRCTLCDVYVFENFMFLELLHCVQLRFVTLRHVTFTLCCFTLCSNIILFPW